MALVSIVSFCPLLIVQVQKADPSYGVGVNPISRLIQIMQAQKKKEPIYTLVAEKGLPRRREFVMQVRKVCHLTLVVQVRKVCRLTLVVQVRKICHITLAVQV